MSSSADNLSLPPRGSERPAAEPRAGRSSGKRGDARTPCARCAGDTADSAKEDLIFAFGHLFHNVCFDCSSCMVMLGNASDGKRHNGEIYCRDCYEKECRPVTTAEVGLGSFGSSASQHAPPLSMGRTTSREAARPAPHRPPAEGGVASCPNCADDTSRSAHEDVVVAWGRVWHARCFECSACHARLRDAVHALEYEGEPHCQTCFEERALPAPSGPGVFGGRAGDGNDDRGDVPLPFGAYDEGSFAPFDGDDAVLRTLRQNSNRLSSVADDSEHRLRASEMRHRQELDGLRQQIFEVPVGFGGGGQGSGVGSVRVPFYSNNTRAGLSAALRA